MIKKRIRSGFTATLFYQCVNFVEALGFVPLFLKSWGSSQYGSWLSLTAFLSYIMLLNLGGQEYIANLATMAYANGNMEGFKRTLSQGISLFAVICGVAFIGLSLLVAAFAVGASFQASELDSSSLLILWFVGTSYLLSIFGGIFSTTYRAVGKYARSMYLGTWWGVFRLIVLAVALSLNATPTLYAFLIFSITVFRAAYYYLDLSHIEPQFRKVSLSLRAAAEGRNYLKGSLLFWGIGLAAALNFQGTLLIVSAGSAPALVALFSTHRTAANLMRYPLGLLQGPILPEITMLWAEKDHIRLRKLIMTSIRFNAMISGLIAVALWIWVPAIYTLWTGRTLQLEPLLLALLLIQNALYCGWSTTSWLRMATNHHRAIALADMLNAGTTILLAAILMPIWGPHGVIIASIVGDLLFGLITYPYLLGRTKLISPSSVYKLLGVAYLPPVAIGMITILLASLFHGIPYLVVATIVFVLGSLTAIFRILDQAQIEWIRQRFFPHTIKSLTQS